MKKTMLIIIMALAPVFAGSKDKGDKCTMDIECAFGLTCTDGVCVKKKEFDFGGSGKSGKKCNIDADCIGAGTCERGISGHGRCTGN